MEAIREGMVVYGEDGRKLGKILRRDGDDLIIEKGLLSKTELVATLDDVARIEGDRVWLRQSASEVEGAAPEGDEAPRASQPSLRDQERFAASGDAEEIEIIEEDWLIDLPPDDDEPSRLGASGRNPNGRR